MSRTATDDGWQERTDRLWRLLEPYHAVVYFAPEHRRACDQLGLRGGWMAYFASRASPLGPVPAQVVAALFYNFHPAMVARAIPDAWGYASPADVVAARIEAVDLALRRLLGDRIAEPGLARAATLARQVAGRGDVAGRPMFAANLALDWPSAPHLVLWQAATMLREHRGDGHVLALAASGINGCQAHVMQVAAGRARRSDLQPFRGWSDEEWGRATAGLVERGWVDAEGRLTAAGRAAHDQVARTTSQLAAEPLRAAGAERVDELDAHLAPIAAALVDADAIPYPNAMGVPRP